ncbi:MAG: hypothetical protein HYY17_12605 [Planctomycetes bacterium]|nr:hypothetical protein [Planctomycetota bacterium]
MKARTGMHASASLPATEAFAAGGAWHSPQGQVVRFFADPALTLTHPEGIHNPYLPPPGLAS